MIGVLDTELRVVRDNKGQDVDVSTLCDADHGLVIFVYPKANTPGQ